MRNMDIYGKKMTVGQKMALVNANMGNPSIAEQQATSRQMYDTLPLNGNNTLNFFQNCQSRVFPMTNLNQNKLQVGESMSVQRIYFAVILFDAASTTVVEDVMTLDTAALPFLYAADYSVYFDTVQEVKDTSLVSQFSGFNKYASFAGNEVMTLDNNIILPSDIQFRCQLKLPTYVAVADTYLRCTWEGFGTIFSPKNQF